MKRIPERIVLSALFALLASGFASGGDDVMSPAAPAKPAHHPQPAAPAPATHSPAPAPVPAAAPVPAPPPPKPPAPAAAAPAAAAPAAAPGKPAFYERYLSDELPLDREIRTVEARCAANPKDAGAHNDLGNLLSLRSFPKEAHAEYQAAEKLDPNLYIAVFNEGLLYEKEGKFGKAKSAFQRTIRKKPGFPEAHFHLGLIYEGEGSREPAISEYSEALRIDNRLRDPSFNPLAVQSRLLYRASVANYRHDMAAAQLQAAGEYADLDVRRALSPEKPIFAEASNQADNDDEEDTEAPSTGPRAMTLMKSPSTTPSARGNQTGGGQVNYQPLTPEAPAARPGSADYRRQMQQRRFSNPRRTPPQSIPVPAPPTISTPPPPPPDNSEESNDQEPPPGVAF